MGKGDKKSRRGKIFMGSYGVRRPRKLSGSPFVPKTAKVVAIVTEQPIVKSPIQQPKPKVVIEKPQVVEAPAPVQEIKYTPPVVVETKPVEVKKVVAEPVITPPPAKKIVEKKAPAVEKPAKVVAKKIAKPAKEKKASAAKAAPKKAAPKASAKKPVAKVKKTKPAAKKTKSKKK